MPIAVQSQADRAGPQVTFNHKKVLCSPLRDTIAWPLLGLAMSHLAKLSLPSRAARVGLPGTNWSINSNVILRGTAQKGHSQQMIQNVLFLCFLTCIFKQ